MKIFELVVDELAEILGLDANALVSKPAHEESFYAFKQVDTEDLIALQIIKHAILENVKMESRLPGESKDDYVSRCIPVLIGEGYEEDQAAAICYETFNFDETEDPQEIVIGDYQTRHYDMCPGASTLYRRIENQEIDTDMGIAIRNAKLQDALFWLEKHTIKEMGKASFEDVKAAEILAGEIMHLARMMGLEDEHQYILGHVQAIRELYLQGDQEEMDIDVSALPDYVAETSGSIVEKNQFKFASEDQRIVVGPLMVPNKQILRVDEKTGEPYMVYFTSDTIAKIAEATMRDEILNRLNVEHDPNQPVQGHMISTWLVKDPEMDTSRAYGFKAYPTGTWFGMYRVLDDKVWAKVKSGELTGFSIEGAFADRYVKTL